MAAAAKIQKKDYFTYVICGDGELQEGVCWEGVNMATGRKLDNLVVFVVQVTGMAVLQERRFHCRTEQHCRSLQSFRMAYTGNQRT